MYFYETIVPRKYSPIIYAVGLFCCDKFEGTTNEIVIGCPARPLCSNLLFTETMDTSNLTATSENENITCPEMSDYEWSILQNISFYVEGVLQSISAVIGILVNMISSIILTRKDIRNR